MGSAEGLAPLPARLPDAKWREPPPLTHSYRISPVLASPAKCLIEAEPPLRCGASPEWLPGTQRTVHVATASPHLTRAQRPM